MDIIQSYKDLCKEIEMWKYRVEAYEAEIEALKKLAKLNGPGYIQAIDYTQPSVQGTSQIGFEEALIRLGQLESHIFIHENAIEKMEQSKDHIEKEIKELDGLDKKVVYMRDIEDKTLKDIANELNYGYDWIRKISARNPKEGTGRPQTKEN